MKKIGIILITIILLCGCSKKEEIYYEANSITYNLFIADYYHETIHFELPENALELATQNEQEDYDSIEYILLKDNFSRPIYNNLETFYQKEIKKKKESYQVDLSFNYTENDFMNENYINTCFENKTIKSEDDYFEIYLSGEFYCRQDKVLTIQVASNYSEVTTNGEQQGNTFQWKINESNQNNVSIYYQVKRDKNNMLKSYDRVPSLNKNNINYVLIEFIMILLIVIGGFIYYHLVLTKNRKWKRKK